MSKKLMLLVSVLMIATMILGACAPAAPQIVEKEKIVEVTKEVKVEVTKEVVKEVPAAPEEKAPNPYTPTNLLELVEKIKEAVKGKEVPANSKYILLTNTVSPFWTAAQIGAARASAEFNVPITFQAPTAADLISQQLSMMETFVNDKYTGILLSSTDRTALKKIVDKAIDEKIPVVCIDSDATGSKRLIYLGMSDFDAGKQAGEAAKKIIGKGKMVGTGGVPTAQNLSDRLAGFKAAIEGSEIELVEVLYDQVKMDVALSNAQTAIQKYPDLAGFITFWSYNGPLAAQAVKQAGMQGKIKIVAFDAEPETQRALSEGVVQAMVVQRVFFYGYLGGYVIHALNVLGIEEGMKMLDPYLTPYPPTDVKDKDGNVTFAAGSEGKILLDTGLDVIEPDTFDLFKEYMNSVGVASQ